MELQLTSQALLVEGRVGFALGGAGPGSLLVSVSVLPFETSLCIFLVEGF